MTIKQIKGFEGYFISNCGKVFSDRRGNKFVELITYDDRGYQRIGLRKRKGSDKKVQVRVHRLVATAFIPNPNKYETVNHLDKDRSNNWVHNLEWANASQQNFHKWAAIKKKVADKESAEQLAHYYKTGEISWNEYQEALSGV